MTNQPHPDPVPAPDPAEEQSIEDMVAAAVAPLAGQLRQQLEAQGRLPSPEQAEVPPASTPNGHAPTTRLMDELPQMLFRAVVSALQQVPVTVRQLPCSTCILGRIAWASVHAAEIAAAEAQMRAVLGQMAADDPRRPMVQLGAFLPGHLQPAQDPANPGAESMPQVNDGVVMVAGTLYCPSHHPQAPQQPAGRRQFLIAQSGITPQMIAEARQMPMPGT